MKFLLIAAAVVAVAVAGPTRFFPISVGPGIVGNPISVGPEIIEHPISVGPEIIDDYESIHVGPEIIDDYEPIHVGPEIIDNPIGGGPVLIDFPIPDGALEPTPVAPAPASSPLVQIIVNVQQAETAPVKPVLPEDHPVDIVDIMPVVIPENHPVDVVDVMPVMPVVPEIVHVSPEILN